MNFNPAEGAARFLLDRYPGIPPKDALDKAMKFWQFPIESNDLEPFDTGQLLMFWPDDGGMGELIRKVFAPELDLQPWTNCSAHTADAVREWMGKWLEAIDAFKTHYDVADDEIWDVVGNDANPAQAALF